MNEHNGRNGSAKLTWMIVGGLVVALASGAVGWFANTDTTRVQLERSDARQDEAIQNLWKQVERIDSEREP